MDSLASLYDELRTDDRRQSLGWTDHMSDAHAEIESADGREGDVADVLRRWLARNQPCVFGKMAASQNRLRVCVLTEAMIRRSDAEIRNQIQVARLEWLQAARSGLASAFIIALISPRLRDAAPDEHLMTLAQHLTQLYLRMDDPAVDAIHTERVYFEVPIVPPRVYEWIAGVNVFASAGDRRWWQDHRIPGGFALSVNSVGHLVKSAHIHAAVADLWAAEGAVSDELTIGKVDTLPKALSNAMQTIAAASKDAPDGPATWLVPRPEIAEPLLFEGKPVEERPALKGFDYRQYRGTYHTDFTLPSVYFRPDVRRPDDATTYDLDFTYLFDDSVENPAFETMGSGRRISSTGAVESTAHRELVSARHNKAVPRIISLQDLIARLDAISRDVMKT